MAVAGQQPDANGITAGHKPVAVMFDLVNPVGTGRGLVGRGWEAGLDELGVGGKPLTHTLDQHAANLGRRRGESNHRRGHHDSAEAVDSVSGVGAN